MTRKATSILMALVLALSLCLMAAMPVVANDEGSSTIQFESITGYTLTDNGDGTYSGVVPCIVDGGFDIYGKEGANAWFGDDPGSGAVWESVAIADHDAWPSWDPDTPDWYQYSLEFYEDSGVQKWAIRNHAGATDSDPWYADNGDGVDIAKGVPLSGTMDWNSMYALETDTGAYLPTTGTPEISGGAATRGDCAGVWDMDWSWGSEYVPMQYPGFDVEIVEDSGTYTVTLTPAPASGTNLYATTDGIIAIHVDPTSIDYGTLYPGQASDVKDITVTNIGNYNVDVSVASLTIIQGSLFTDANFTIDGGNATAWTSTGLAVDASDIASSQLSVPSGYIPQGAEQAKIVFMATEAP